jgi:hypothetical protein
MDEGCLLVSAASLYELACLYPRLAPAQKSGSFYICSVSGVKTILPLLFYPSLYIFFFASSILLFS